MHPYTTRTRKAAEIMPVYEYTAFDREGRKRQGSVEAVSIETARARLREMDIFPTALTETAVGGRKGEAAKSAAGRLFKKVRLGELAVMTRQLSTLLAAGLPLVPSLNALVAQIRQPELRQSLARIRDEINEGNSLTTSLALFPAIFPPVYINMVRAGEASGTLDLVLERLAEFYESQQAMKMKIQAAMAYPVFMFFIGSAVLLFLVAFVVPRITEIFTEMHQTLPAITIFLIAVSGFLKSFWWLALVALAGAAGAIRYAVTKTEKGRYAWDRLKITTPLVGPINRKIALARFSRTLGTLLQGGVPLLAALDIVENIVDNRLISDEIKKAKRDVEEGQSLSAPLARSNLFPPIVTEMISVGEQSGTMEKMLFRISDAYDKEVESGILMMTSLLEPVMILVMGLVVGFIVVSIFLPLFEMNQLVR
jgi:general secretion pathway protein F